MGELARYFGSRFRRRRVPGIASPVDSGLRFPSGVPPYRQGRTGDSALEDELGVRRVDKVAEELGLNPRPVYRRPGSRR